MGHDSQSDDWCDVCGSSLALTTGTASGRPGPGGRPEAEVTERPQTCPACGASMTGRFCEECGYSGDSRDSGAHHAPPATDFALPVPSANSVEATAVTVAVTMAIAPFVQALVSRAAEDAYDGARQLLRKISRRHHPDDQLVVNDPQADLTFRIHVDATDEALRALAGLDLAVRQSAEGPAEVIWNNKRRRWEIRGESCWVAVVRADREYFTQMTGGAEGDEDSLSFPPYCPERRIPLTGLGRLRIGRKSQRRGLQPEIDLSVPPADPGVSLQHAVLEEQSDGSWTVVDLGSLNGTTVNTAPDPIAPYRPVPLEDGDRVHVGAWTTITLHRA